MRLSLIACLCLSLVPAVAFAETPTPKQAQAQVRARLSRALAGTDRLLRKAALQAREQTRTRARFRQAMVFQTAARRAAAAGDVQAAIQYTRSARGLARSLMVSGRGLGVGGMGSGGGGVSDGYRGKDKDGDGGKSTRRPAKHKTPPGRATISPPPPPPPAAVEPPNLEPTVKQRGGPAAEEGPAEQAPMPIDDLDRRDEPPATGAAQPTARSFLDEAEGLVPPPDVLFKSPSLGAQKKDKADISESSIGISESSIGVRPEEVPPDDRDLEGISESSIGISPDRPEE